MKLLPDTWWLACPPLLRKVIKTVLALLALYCAFQFFGFGFHHNSSGDSSVTHEHSSFTIGTPEPWYHWEKTTERTDIKNSTGNSVHVQSGFNISTNSGFNLFTRSFGAGILCLLISMLLFRIGRCEKARQNGMT
jgi:hypothetical protein